MPNARSEKNTIYSLDFGTTTICVAETRDGISKVLPCGGPPDAPELMPSAVAQTPSGDRFGTAAIGVPMVDGVGGTLPPIKTAITNGVFDDEVRDRVATLISRAVEAAGISGVSDVVLGCPASWDRERRSQLVEAAQQAGLSHASLSSVVDEPIAAGASFLKGRQAQNDPFVRGHVLVIDMGGGTTDVAVMAASEPSEDLVDQVDAGLFGKIRVLSSRGSVSDDPGGQGAPRHLGGDDIDASLAQRLQWKTDNLSQQNIVSLTRSARETLEREGSPEVSVEAAQGVLTASDVRSAYKDFVDRIVGELVMPALRDAFLVYFRQRDWRGEVWDAERIASTPLDLQPYADRRTARLLELGDLPTLKPIPKRIITEDGQETWELDATQEWVVLLTGGLANSAWIRELFAEAFEKAGKAVGAAAKPAVITDGAVSRAEYSVVQGLGSEELELGKWLNMSRPSIDISVNGESLVAGYEPIFTDSAPEGRHFLLGKEGVITTTGDGLTVKVTYPGSSKTVLLRPWDPSRVQPPRVVLTTPPLKGVARVQGKGRYLVKYYASGLLVITQLDDSTKQFWYKTILFSEDFASANPSPQTEVGAKGEGGV